ncbi:MAG: ribosome maturation factor RimM [Methylotenera sp.]|uniref:ribosome maturation factor RimM n=1 Tax=Methylotenera sp. TaxID=2051956 RepID=UPI0017FA2DE0|nr:ribosome maturation factor RimM [Methylotenera sp.]NOU26093.1 ribosome maturation factor RimM [Methylotenera sp.]
MVIMGRVVAPYGVFGWLKVVPDTEAFDGLFDYDTWWLGKGNDWREMVVETAKIHNDVLVVKLEGIDDRDAAFACKGKQIAVPRDALPEPEKNEYYWSDLIGVHVKNKQDIDFGLIVDVFETGANDVIAVRADAIQPEASTDKAVAKEKPQERLIPFIDAIVLEVDIAAKTMLVDWDADF